MAGRTEGRIEGRTEGRIWRLPADIDTDVLAPGRWMKGDLATLAAHCLEAVRPEFAREVRPGDVIAAGPNFGVGSSREQAAGALKHLGVAAVIAPSFAGIFYRNAINLGLPVLRCAAAESLAEGECVTIELSAGVVTRESGSIIRCEPLPPFLWDIVAAGGLFASLKRRPLRPES